VVELCRQLLSSPKVKVGTGDIGVICGFRRQVLKLRKLLRSNGLGNVNVGQVEDFQGREDRVVIVTTVLARKDFLHRARLQQYTHHSTASSTSAGASAVPDSGGGGGDNMSLGLLLSPKRFNVAMTRAKALAIVVGSPDVLVQDPCWRRYLEHCASERAWFGCGCDELGVGLNGTNGLDGSDPTALLEHLGSLNLEGNSLLGGAAVEEVYPDLGTSAGLGGQYNDEKEWRVML